MRQANSSANYANGGDGANGATQLPQMSEPLYTGPIHTLCRVGDDSLLSGGVDKVQKNFFMATLDFANIVRMVCCRACVYVCMSIIYVCGFALACLVINHSNCLCTDVF